AAANHAAAVMMSQVKKPIQVSFQGRVQFPSASELVVTSLSGKIKKDQFTGTGTGSLSGTLFLGGDVFLSNSKGAIHLQLGPAIQVKGGKHPRQKVSVVVVDANGKYASLVGHTGTLSTWNVPARQNAKAKFGGTLNA